MQIFYNINANSIKSLILNCELLMEKLKKKYNKKVEEDLKESVEKSESMIKNDKQMDLSSNNVSINKNGENQTKVFISRGSKFFIFFIFYLC